MGKKPDDAERFFRELADGLELLGDAESLEVVTEVRSHFAQAVAEANGDQAAVLTRFGSPATLATRILQERGVLCEGTEVPEAPVWMRSLAVALDAARWLVLASLLLSFFFIGVGDHGAAVTTTLMILAWIYLAAVLGWISWWWGWRRRHIPATIGMSVVGLRRVHLARSTRIVRTRDIPGARRGLFEVLGALAWALLVVAIVSYGGYLWVSGYVSSSKTNQQAQMQDAINDTTQAVSLVQDIYQKVLAGQDVTDSFAPAALSAANQLSARHVLGVFDGYSLTQVQLPDYKPIMSYSNATGRMIVALVSITESQRQGSVTYEYRVVYRVTRAEQNGNGGFMEGRWLIEDVTQVS